MISLLLTDARKRDLSHTEWVNMTVFDTFEILHRSPRVNSYFARRIALEFSFVAVLITTPSLSRR